MSVTLFHRTTLAICVCAFCLNPSYAETTNLNKNENITKHKQSNNTLEEIVVYGEQNKSLTSAQSITQDQMKKTPVSNGNISDYLRSNPHVRYENSDQNGFQRGEIMPENISINGADFNQTAYFVDNVNVNNDLTIDSNIFDGAMQTVPGISNTQAYFFDASMLSTVEVQDSNISASLGGFMGGAVVAKTKQYNGKDGLTLKYRTTNSSWATMNIDSNANKVLKHVQPDSTGKAELQPKYNKQFFSITAEKGLTDNLGMVIGFSHRNSKIEQNRIVDSTLLDNPDPFASSTKIAVPVFGKQNHTRLSDNILLNFNWTPTLDDRFELSGRYSNYREEKYYPENRDNNVADYHQTYGATLAWVHAFDSGVWTNTFAYDHFNDKRRSSSASVEVVTVNDDLFEPLYNYEKGGYGNSKLSQKNLHFSTEYALEPFDFKATNHSISIGSIYQATNYKFNRPQEVNQTIKFISEPVDPMFTIPPINSTTPKGSAKVKYQNIVFYAEDLIKWKNIEFRPGIRFERDDYLENNNLAPRFVVHYKPWQDTNISLGLNRYYGRSFASLKLSEQILKINGDNERLDRYQHFEKLKTPYADELSLGFDQNIGNFAFKLNYLKRKNKDRIILDEQNNKKLYRNGNDFGVDIYTFQINNLEPWQLGKTYWTTSLGFDYLNTKRFDKAGYNPLEAVFLDGKLMTRKEMEQKVNSSTDDWVTRIGIDMAIPNYDITWSNKIYIKAPIKGYDEINSGSFNNDIPRYRTFDYGKHTQWDSSFRWQPTFKQQHSVYLQVDVLNVLNQTRKIKNNIISSGSEYGIYSPGREFWLQVGYEF